VPTGTRSSSLFDRLERSATSCLLIVLASGATAGIGRAAVSDNDQHESVRSADRGVDLCRAETFDRETSGSGALAPDQV
jgi:hypothetical protein